MEKYDGQKIRRTVMRKIDTKVIDIYIIKKFLGTYFLALTLIMTIAVIFDFSEKIDDFLEKEAPARAIIFDYYLNFVPYFSTLFSPLFTFITVIYFTSRMAYNTEIIAILSSGVSFRRLMLPYFYSSLFIAILVFLLTNFIIPHSNMVRLDFEDKYYKSKPRYTATNIHRQVFPNVYVYMESYNTETQLGRNFSIERFNDEGQLESKLASYYVRWDTVLNKWSARQYHIRDIIDGKEFVRTGRRIDTSFTILPDDFARRPTFVETMNYRELRDQIRLMKLQGSDEILLLQNERHRRFSNPFSVFILTLIGVSVSSKKVRGGIGMQIGLGLALSFTYIFFMQFATQFSLKGNLDPLLAMWIPNMLYLIIGIFLYKAAPK